MLGYLSADIICSEQRTVFRERSSRKTVSYEEQIMSKDKYPSIFSPLMEAIVFIILQIFFATRAVLKIGEYPRICPSFSWGIFAHVTHLDQSRASENIWWIIILDSLAPKNITCARISVTAFSLQVVSNTTSTTIWRRGIGTGSPSRLKATATCCTALAPVSKVTPAPVHCTLTNDNNTNRIKV